MPSVSCWVATLAATQQEQDGDGAISDPKSSNIDYHLVQILLAMTLLSSVFSFAEVYQDTTTNRILLKTKILLVLWLHELLSTK